MESNKVKLIHTVILLCTLFVLGSCTVSYKFNASMIDYTKTKSISIADFPSVAEANLYTALPYEFTEELRNIYTRQTRLQILKTSGDMHLEGEITDYQITPLAIAADSYSSETKLTINIRVRFTNKAVPDDDFEKTYSAFRTFSSDITLNDAQAQLMPEIIKDLTESIFNDTAGKW